MREPDLQVAVKSHSELPRLRVEGGMLFVREELRESVPIQDARVLARNLCTRRDLRALGAGQSLPERSIAFRPAEPVFVAVLRGERGVQRVALQPEAIALGKLREPSGVLAWTARLE